MINNILNYGFCDDIGAFIVRQFFKEHIYAKISKNKGDFQNLEKTFPIPLLLLENTLTFPYITCIIY